MKITQAKRIVANLKKKGLGCEVRENYSGRGMWGRTTPAVVVFDSFDAIEAEASSRVLKGSKSDSMGLGVVYY